MIKLSPLRTAGHLQSLVAGLRDLYFPQYGETSPAEAAELVRSELDAVCPPGISDAFMEHAAALRILLESDVQALLRIDPAAQGEQEIVYCYPAVTAMLCYRTAHELLNLGVPVVPRMLTELSHSRTGIDIHPGAVIGEGFAIDHGTGVVIGETAIIGRNVSLYQGVTLGARSLPRSADGKPLRQARHPILEDGVTVYSNASILGRVTIGEGSVIGGNVWLTHSVPPHSRILQGRAQESFSDGAGI